MSCPTTSSSWSSRSTATASSCGRRPRSRGCRPTAPSTASWRAWKCRADARDEPIRRGAPMIPTRRFLFLLLLGGLIVGGASFAQPLVWLAVVYFVALLGLVIADYVVSTKPEQLTLTRL